MPKRQLGSIFETARAFTPKPHAPCLVAATGRLITPGVAKNVNLNLDRKVNSIDPQGQLH